MLGLFLGHRRDPHHRRVGPGEKGKFQPWCHSPGCTPHTLGPERASSLQLLRQPNPKCPEPWAESWVVGMRTARGFHSFRVPGSWAGSVRANGFPKMYNFKSWKTFFSPSKCIAPHNCFIIRIIAKETRESSSAWCLTSAEAGTRVPRAQDRAYLSATIRSSGSLSFSPSLPLCVLQLQHKLFAREVSLYDPIQHTQEKTVGDRPNVLTNLS